LRNLEIVGGKLSLEFGYDIGQFLLGVSSGLKIKMIKNKANFLSKIKMSQNFNELSNVLKQRLGNFVVRKQFVAS
jgi:hypothetical protein